MISFSMRPRFAFRRETNSLQGAKYFLSRRLLLPERCLKSSHLLRRRIATA
jgi:hypothetical protein